MEARGSLTSDFLEVLVSKVVVVFLSNKTAITGKLLEFDDEACTVSGDFIGDIPNLLFIKHISMIRSATLDEAKRYNNRIKGQ